VFRDTDVVDRTETDGGVGSGSVADDNRLEPIFEDRIVDGLAYSGVFGSVSRSSPWPASWLARY